MKKTFFAFFIVTFLFTNKVFAHVGYVIDKETQTKVMGKDFNFLLSPLFDVNNLVLMLVSIIVLSILVLVFYDLEKIRNLLSSTRSMLKTYHEFVPLIIRCALGVMLIGSGSTGTLISPLIESHTGLLNTLQIALGFFFFTGFLLIPSALITIGLYFYALFTNFYILGNFDVLALLLAFFIYHSARPGLDEIFHINLLSKIHIPRHLLSLTLRIGIGVSMIFLALYEKILNPHMSEAVVFQYNLTSVINVSASMWVFSAGIIEFCVGLFLILGLYTRLTAIIAFILLTASFFFFNEAVYSHVTLFAILAIIIIEGGNYFSLDSKRLKINL